TEARPAKVYLPTWVRPCRRIRSDFSDRRTSRSKLQDIVAQAVRRGPDLARVTQEACPQEQFPSRTEGGARRQRHLDLVDNIEGGPAAVGYAVNLEEGIEGTLRLQHFHPLRGDQGIAENIAGYSRPL